MSEVIDEARWFLPRDVGQPDRDPDIEFIMAGWPFVAATAWQEYRQHGRGTVMVDEDRNVTYLPGSPCPCHKHLVDSYDPEQHAVVALHSGDTIRSIHIVTGWPAPPDAYRITPGERLRLTAH